YMLDPAEYGVRRLAQRHGLSLAHVDTTLRLGGLEEHWEKVISSYVDTSIPAVTEK
ncbi:hypothetical protein GY45DRAFT_1261984, partial [Cubamyces sp. BRFM 1775]